MPRKLPWLTKDATKKDASSSSPAPKRRKRESSPGDLVDANLDDVATPPPRPKQLLRAGRSPSTSPIRPSTADAEPEPEYMRPGYDADDIHMMVEDEFEETAKWYTKNFHVAGWEKSKRLAKARGEKTLAALHHGTDGRTEKSRGLRLREESEAMDRKMKDVLDEEARSSDEDDAPYKHDPQLAGLMNTGAGRSGGRELAGMIKAKSNTRAAAGFMESPHAPKRHRDVFKEEEDDAAQTKTSSSKMRGTSDDVSEDDDEEDDLDAKPLRKPVLKRREVEGVERSNRNDASDSNHANVFKRFAEPPHDRSSEALRQPAATQIKIEDLDDPYDFPRPRAPMPTYKKAQNRAAAQTLSGQNSSKPTPASSGVTGSGKGLFSRSSLTFTANGSKTAHVKIASPQKGEYSSSKATDSQTSPGRSEARAAAAEHLAKRVAERARREKQQQQGKAKRIDEIPTFLF